MRRNLRGCGTGVLTFGVVLLVAVAGVVLGLRLFAGNAASGVCVAETADLRATLSADQADNAALLSGVATRRGLPARAVTIAIATALQESKLRNIDYGDRDSVGLFQQRPSQGWGSVAEIMDPVYSTEAFYDALVTVEEYGSLPITDAAQRVQRSAYPQAYAQHEPRARAFASAMTGHSPAALTCHLDPVDEDETPAVTAAVADRLERDLGLSAEVLPGGVLRTDATALPGGSEEARRLAWAVAQWAVATASTTGASVVVVVDGQAWTRGGETSTWSSLDEARLPEAALTATEELAPGSVLVL
ncbi:hypothetical protein PU560_15595 [Georgenia sp. 10Sc9-8]|uniref:Heavy metal transporter n=1 Tax=Georgenia halotolerans TaxID=3028317 RepID=A0ABT5U341_9MICO|nr:hypothetical protein [Georgenia halotolerans]